MPVKETDTGPSSLLACSVVEVGKVFQQVWGIKEKINWCIFGIVGKSDLLPKPSGKNKFNFSFALTYCDTEWAEREATRKRSVHPRHIHVCEAFKSKHQVQFSSGMSGVFCGAYLFLLPRGTHVYLVAHTVLVASEWQSRVWTFSLYTPANSYHRLDRPQVPFGITRKSNPTYQLHRYVPNPLYQS